jgi:photosynthetic reaction center cytochrome c subunit
MRFNIIFGAILASLLGFGFVVYTFERPPVATVQQGFRGTSMGQVVNQRLTALGIPNNTAPEPLEAADPEGPRASEVYENVQVLGHLSVEQFGRVMQAMTVWVYPENEADPENSGCNACHVPGNFAADDKYQKVVARRMTQMVQTINGNWTNHVGATGVTCYTCHRGNAIPANVWAQAPANSRTGGFAATAPEQNRPIAANGYASLPTDPFTPYLSGEQSIRMQTRESHPNRDLPNGNRQSIQQTEWNYALMNHFSSALGVNCTYCHNSRAFSSWAESPPQRATAWYGIRMVRDINNTYIDPLQPVFPPHRLGVLGDPLKTNCTTCHQGAWAPLYGAPMLRDYPELAPPPRATRADATPR